MNKVQEEVKKWSEVNERTRDMAFLYTFEATWAKLVAFITINHSIETNVVNVSQKAPIMKTKCYIDDVFHK